MVRVDRPRFGMSEFYFISFGPHLQKRINFVDKLFIWQIGNIRQE